MVVLKTLSNSQNIMNDFLKEISYHKLFNDGDLVVKCYGISQDPITKEYMMVMSYIREGNLRQYLSDNYNRLTFKNKLDCLTDIISGLETVHNQKLIHKDFHPGNILNRGNVLFYVADLGLSVPADKEKNEEIYGVLPYVAPEVLLRESYTQSSDIYSFGIIAYEILTGLLPYYDKKHDVNLALEICQGTRPKFQIKIPQLLEDLIKRC
jgi:serine/threonine protein kinase